MEKASMSREEGVSSSAGEQHPVNDISPFSNGRVENKPATEHALSDKAGTTTATKKPSLCLPCQQARSAPDFLSRTTRLLDPLHCSACHEDHSAVLFSQAQRQAPDASRICIGHEGHYTVCPHLKLTFKNIVRWLRDGRTSRILCLEPSCPFGDARVNFNVKPHGHTIQAIWDAEPHEAIASSFQSRCAAKLQYLYQLYPNAFCPHLQVSPDSFARESENAILNNTSVPLTWGMPELCHRCGDRYRCDPRAAWLKLAGMRVEGRKAKTIEKLGWLHVGGDQATSASWISRLDPESYGHFGDEATKHFTWCDDRTCSTTYEMCRWESLVEVISASDIEHIRDAFHTGDSGLWCLDLVTEMEIDKSLV